jgi:hypothetical protein
MCRVESGSTSKTMIGHPVDRMIRVHAASVARAARCRRESAIAGAPGPSDARRCRIVVNALRREIDRLRRGIDRVDLCGAATRARECFAAPAAGRNPCGPPASPPPARKGYAPDPLGKVREAAAIPPPPPPPVISIDNYCHITNLGTLLDMLA